MTLIAEGEPDYCRAAMYARERARATAPVPVIGWLSGSRLPAYLTAPPTAPGTAPPAAPPTRPANASGTAQATHPAGHAQEPASAPLIVLVATHPDTAGDRYADTIRDQAGPHVRVIRTRPPRDLDECTVGELDELFGRWV